MRVRNGRVQKKNRWAQTPNYFLSDMPSLVIDRRRPGCGCRHVVRKEHVRRFVELLPTWKELSEGLNAIVLDSGHMDCMGWHRPGVVALCAWEQALEWDDCEPDFHRSHSAVFCKLDIPVEIQNDRIHVGFTEATARAFLLIHVLVHELGHHHDRITSRNQRCSRGESYAEQYARRHEDEIIRRYRKEFSM